MKSIKTVFILTFISIISGLALAWVNQKTKERIKREEQRFTLRSLEKTLPEFDNNPDKDSVVLEEEGERFCIYRGKKRGKIAGFAITSMDPNGYSGNVKIVVGLLPDGTISGIEILSHAETPGLGARIEERSFREKLIWNCLDCANKERRSLNNTKWSVKKDGGDIDEISGATISSRAVTRATLKALKLFEKYKEKIISMPSKRCD